MITKFKLYENIDQDKPKVGDYVLCYEESISYIGGKYLNDFLLNNIGEIEYIDNRSSIPYYVEYENIPSDLDKWFHDAKLNCRSMRRSEILHWSRNKKELEIFITQNKYNL